MRDIFPDSDDKRRYWRRVLRMAALLHDVGHLPFSHAAEHELLPPGWDHEHLTVAIICSPEMHELWGSLTPPLRAEDIAKLAVGPRKLKTERFMDWEAILSEIVVGDAFGADRIDYLLRDSHHTGVAYGRFDHHRLIDTLRILRKAWTGQQNHPSGLKTAGCIRRRRYCWRGISCSPRCIAIPSGEPTTFT